MLKYLEIYRKEAGLTQAQLAEKINVKRYNIADWEQGRTEPSLANLVALAKALNTSVEFLLGIDNFAIEEIEQHYERILDIFRDFKNNDLEIQKGDLVKMKYGKYYYRPEVVCFKKGDVYNVDEVLKIKGRMTYLILNGNYYYTFGRKELEIY